MVEGIGFSAHTESSQVQRGSSSNVYTRGALFMSTTWPMLLKTAWSYVGLRALTRNATGGSAGTIYTAAAIVSRSLTLTPGFLYRNS